MLEIIGGILRLRLVQPEHVDAVAIVIFFYFVPDELPGLRIGGIIDHCIPLEVEALYGAPLSPHHQPSLVHFTEIHALPVHGGPYGDHAAHAHLFQFVHHSLRVGPVLRVEVPIPLPDPMEKVYHDDIQGNPAPLIFPGHLQHLLLGAVAQLALPQAQGILREFGSPSRDSGIVLQDGLRIVVRRDPVVQLLGQAAVPLGIVGSEHHLADSGIVPQEAVTFAGDIEGHADLGVALGQLQDAAFQIQVRLLILPHAVYLLALLSLEAHCDAVITAADRLELAGEHFHAGAVLIGATPVSGVFFQYDLAVLRELQPAAVVQRAAYLPVPDDGPALRHANLHLRCLGHLSGCRSRFCT